MAGAILALWMGGVLTAQAQLLPATAAPPEDPQRLLDQGFEHFYNLEYDQAIAIFQKLRDADATDPLSQNRVALAYFYRLLYRSGALQGELFSASNKIFRVEKIQVNTTEGKNFWQANNAAIGICEARLKRNENDEEALYACGVAYAARATYEGLVERSRLALLSSARKANDYHSRLLRRNPRYYDAYLVPGLYDFVLGSLPGPLKVLLFFAGLSGDKQRGIHTVESVAAWGDRAKQDAKIVLVVMYRREKRYEDARQTLADLARTFPRNYLLPLEIASLNRAAGEVPEAIQGYEQVLEKIRRETPGYQKAPAARIHYELGELYRESGELESARKHLEQVAGSRGSTPELDKQSVLLRQQVEEALRQRERPVLPSLGPASVKISLTGAN